MPYKARNGKKGIKTGDMHTQEQYDMAREYVTVGMAKKKLAGHLGMSVAEYNRNMPARKTAGKGGYGKTSGVMGSKPPKPNPRKPPARKRKATGKKSHGKSKMDY